MSITYGFFNSVNHDRVYNADTMSDMFRGLLSDGVYNGLDDGFAVTPSDGMVLSVGAGRAIVDDRWVDNDAPVTVTISPANSALPRIDLVILRKSMAARTVSLLVLQGTPSSTPAAPSIVRTESTYDLCLARVRVNAGATSITAADITDTRSDGTVCGWVTGLVRQVDTSNLFAQFSAAYQDQMDQLEQWEADTKAQYDAWFDDLTDELRVDTTIHRSRTITVIRSNLDHIDAPSFDAGDVVEVYCNGLLMPENLYEITGSGGRINFYAERRVGDVLQVVVTHAQIGS